jgi:hypothetical protein
MPPYRSMCSHGPQRHSAPVVAEPLRVRQAVVDQGDFRGVGAYGRVSIVQA